MSLRTATLWAWVLLVGLVVVVSVWCLGTVKTDHAGRRRRSPRVVDHQRRDWLIGWGLVLAVYLVAAVASWLTYRWLKGD